MRVLYRNMDIEPSSGWGSGYADQLVMSRRNVNWKYFTFSGFYEPVAQLGRAVDFLDSSRETNLCHKEGDRIEYSE